MGERTACKVRLYLILVVIVNQWLYNSSLWWNITYSIKFVYFKKKIKRLLPHNLQLYISIWMDIQKFLNNLYTPKNIDERGSKFLKSSNAYYFITSQEIS